MGQINNSSNESPGIQGNRPRETGRGASGLGKLLCLACKKEGTWEFQTSESKLLPIRIENAYFSSGFLF